MSKLSITNAWNETTRFVQANFGPLLLIVFAFQVLPLIAVQFFVQDPLLSGGVNPATVDRAQIAAFLARMFPIIVILGILGLIGTLAVMALALGRGETVGDAFSLALRRLLPFLGASLLLVLAMMVAAVPLSVVAAAGGPGAKALATLVLLAFLLFILVRMLLMSPVAVAEKAGPVEMLGRTWRLTSGHFWKLLGFVLLLVIAFLVISLAANAIFGILVALIFGPPEPRSLSALLGLLFNGVLSAGFTIVYLSMIARIYVQLSSADTGRAVD